MSSPSATQAQRNRTRLLAAGVVIVLTAIIAWSLRGAGRADALDGWWLRARFAWRESVQPATTDSDIVLVEIDDRSLARWKEPLFLWGPHLAAAMNHLTASGARLIALDWIQPQSVEEYFPGHEAPLMQALQRTRNVVLVKEFKPDGSEILPAPQLLYSLPNAYQDPQAHLGYAELSNQESIVAAFRPTLAREDQGREVSFAARIAERATRNPAGSTPVPLREDGTVLINYRSRKKGSAFPRYSLYDVASAKAADKRFKNKIVIIGAAYTGSNDSHYVPILEGVSGARLLPGPELQAHATRTLLSNQPIREPGAAMVVLLALLPAVLAIPAWLRWSWVGAALASLGIALVWIAAAFLLFSFRDFALPIVLPLGCLAFAATLMGGFRALGEERERRAVLGLWGRYQDPRLVEYLIEHPAARGGQGNETEVTVLFADLKNFTKTVQHLEPEAALRALNRYLSLMTDVIRDEHGGVIDKYLGDGLMAQWGAPQAWSGASAGDEHHAAVAIRACLELQRRAHALTHETRMQQPGDDITFELRLTLHSGSVVVGWVGAERIEYTIIGDNVNVCARLQETAKELGCDFLISETTRELARPLPLEIGKTSEVAIRGRDHTLGVYEVLGVLPEEEPDLKPVNEVVTNEFVIQE